MAKNDARACQVSLSPRGESEEVEERSRTDLYPTSFIPVETSSLAAERMMSSEMLHAKVSV